MYKKRSKGYLQKVMTLSRKLDKEIKCITHPNNTVKWTLEPTLVEPIVTSDDLRVV